MDPLRIFDGHNDTLLRMHHEGAGLEAFLEGRQTGHLDLPRARAGGLGGGLFAIFAPPDPELPQGFGLRTTPEGYELPLAPPLAPDAARRLTLSLAARLFRWEAASAGRLRVVRTLRELRSCLDEEILAAVLHLEGAEALDPELELLEVLYQAGLRSLGIVWSRPNLFATGTPFRCPGTPDTGPGLTPEGRRLVEACNRLGIQIDLSHLNERGFWDVAELSEAPLVATHSSVHALSPCTRNLTDRQIQAVARSGGLVGINFAVGFLRPDGKEDPDTPLELLVRHVAHVAELVGVEHVAFGSDFDGAVVPRELGDAAGLPRLIQALRDHGFDESSLEKIARDNWMRVLGKAWHG